jgi:hypothetical protein
MEKLLMCEHIGQHSPGCHQKSRSGKSQILKDTGVGKLSDVNTDIYKKIYYYENNYGDKFPFT